MRRFPQAERIPGKKLHALRVFSVSTVLAGSGVNLLRRLPGVYRQTIDFWHTVLYSKSRKRELLKRVSRYPFERWTIKEGVPLPVFKRRSINVSGEEKSSPLLLREKYGGI